MKRDIKDMDDEELIQQFEDTVRGWHYDPKGAYERMGDLDYEIDELKEELLRRLEEGD